MQCNIHSANLFGRNSLTVIFKLLLIALYVSTSLAIAYSNLEVQPRKCCIDLSNFRCPKQYLRYV